MLQRASDTSLGAVKAMTVVYVWHKCYKQILFYNLLCDWNKNSWYNNNIKEEQ